MTSKGMYTLVFLVVLAIISGVVIYLEFAPLIVVAKYYLYAVLPIMGVSYLATERPRLLSGGLIAIFVIVMLVSIVVVLAGGPAALMAKWVLGGQLVFMILSLAIWNRNMKLGEHSHEYKFAMLVILLYLLFIGFLYISTGSVTFALGIGVGIPVAIILILIILLIIKAIGKKDSDE